MNIVKPSVEIIDMPSYHKALKKIERIGRVCYKSEDRITEDSDEKFVVGLMKYGHESVIEHESISIKVTCDRGISHEIVRHRIASYSQESTRYCNYAMDRFGSEITVVKPCYLKDGKPAYEVWKRGCEAAEQSYFELLELGCTPQEARAVLPTALKTEIVMTMNLREWRHFLKLRTASDPHSQMQEIATLIQSILKAEMPAFFADI